MNNFPPQPGKYYLTPKDRKETIYNCFHLNSEGKMELLSFHPDILKLIEIDPIGECSRFEEIDKDKFEVLKDIISKAQIEAIALIEKTEVITKREPKIGSCYKYQGGIVKVMGKVRRSEKLHLISGVNIPYPGCVSAFFAPVYLPDLLSDEYQEVEENTFEALESIVSNTHSKLVMEAFGQTPEEIDEEYKRRIESEPIEWPEE